MNRATSIVLLVLAPVVSAQDAGDGCGSALDSFNRLKESFYANAESLDPKLAYSNLVTATRNCPEWGELWEFRAILGRQSGASKADIDHSLRKARELGWEHTDTSSGSAYLTALPDRIDTKWALLVGIGKFKDARAPTLKYSVADAVTIRDLLIDKNVGRFPAANVRLLTNEEANVIDIRAGIGWLRVHAKPNDLVVVYFASHGLARDKDPNGVSYIVANDSSLENAETRYATSIQMIDLVNSLTRELQSLRLILILDTCYSGDAGSARGQAAVSTLKVSQMASFGESLRLFQKGAGRAVLTAASADQLSYESDRLGHGYFSYFLINALKESSGRATLGELYKQVRESTEQAVRTDLGKVQTPLLVAGSAAAGITLGVEPGQ